MALEREDSLPLACSPDKRLLLRTLVSAFTEAHQKSLDSLRSGVVLLDLNPDQLLAREALYPYVAVAPESSLWLDELEFDADSRPEEPYTRLLNRSTYARSPLVIALWEEVAKSFGYPAQPLGWNDLLLRAEKDPGFRWSHLSPHSAGGVLTLTAFLHAGLQTASPFTLNDLGWEDHHELLRRFERTVKHYGETEEGVVRALLQQGRGFLDACVLQEQSVLGLNHQLGREASHKLATVYPREGTFVLEHPLALVRFGPKDTAVPAHLVHHYEAFRSYLESEAGQRTLAEHGYRPVQPEFAGDFKKSLRESGTPFAGSAPIEIPTTLPLPSVPVLRRVRDLWRPAKRPTNVYLLADTSSSMAGIKLDEARQGLREFVLLLGDNDRVGLIDFGSWIKKELPLEELNRARPALLGEIGTLSADGRTALLDAVRRAYELLQARSERDRINAVVVMTDGQENNSSVSPANLVRQIEDGNRAGVRVVIFCVAYGPDADFGTLNALAQASGGDVSRGDTASIRNLYSLLARRL